MKTEDRRICPNCGNEFSGAMEFCPVCTLRQALKGGVESGVSSSEDILKLTPEQATQRFEHYELLMCEDGKPLELGRGAMGITYKAHDIDLQCPVALKVISERYLGDESARLRFLREARLAARLRHSNVASVLHLGRTGSSYFYAMEFVEGETLEKLIKRSRQIEVKFALEIATQVAAGLSAVHKQKLVHRDIKPSNIMVNVEEGGTLTAKIIDLGLAKSAPDTPADAAISIPGTFAGTPEFASPEQFAGAGVDTRSDLYSLGLVLWVMLTGHVVFSGSPAELAASNKGLCVITTRTLIADIAEHEGSAVLNRDLEQLSSDAGASLLRALGVKGDELELRKASDEFSGHCLALTLLGSYLTDAYDGDVRCRGEVSGHLVHDVRQGVHARLGRKAISGSTTIIERLRRSCQRPLRTWSHSS